MRDRVAVQAVYEYAQRGFLSTGSLSHSYFFCEVPRSWIEERDRLHERFFTVCAAELKDLCALVNAGEEFPDTHRVSLQSVIVTVLGFLELQARPWHYAAQPFNQLGTGFPKYSSVDEKTGRLVKSDVDDFQKRADEDLLVMRASLPPIQNAELLTRDILGKCFLCYAEHLVTDTGYSVDWSDDGQSEGQTYAHRLYRLSARTLIIRKERSEYSDNRSDTISLDYFRSDDDGVYWRAAPEFDAAALHGLTPISEWP